MTVNLAIFVNFVSAQIVHAWGNQPVPELLLKPSDTMHEQCWHMEHLHDEVGIEFYFDKITLFWTFFYIFYTFVS